MTHRRRVQFAAVAIILGLLLAELAARGARSVALTHSEPAWFAYDADLGWRAAPNWRGVHRDEPLAKAFDAEGFQLVDAADLTTTGAKVLVLGDSTAYGFGVPPELAWPEQLDRALSDVAVINAAYMGYSSAQGAALARRLIPRFRPAWVIVSFNFNDRRFKLRPQELDSPAYFALLRAAALRREALARWGIGYWMLRLSGSSDDGRSFGARHATPAVADVRTLRMRVGPTDYRRNLESIVQTATAAGARTLLVQMCDNPRMADPLRAACDRAATHRAVGLQDLRAYIADPPTGRADLVPLARLEAAALLDADGHPQDATELARLRHPQDSVHGGQTLAFDRDYREQMVAASQATGALLFDAEPLLRAQPDQFFDQCHFWSDAHAALGQAIAARLSTP